MKGIVDGVGEPHDMRVPKTCLGEPGRPRMTRAFITGGTGYVGARLAAYLAAEGHSEVTVATRQELTELPYLPDVAVRQVDMSDKQSLARAMRGHTTVYHLAAAGQAIAAREPRQAIKDNVTDALNVLDAAIECGLSRFVNFSTVMVYGRVSGKISEDGPTRPLQTYEITHLAFEHFLRSRDSRQEIEGVNIRLGNAIGPPQHAAIDRWNLLTNDLCRMAVEEGALRLKSDGTHARDFLGLSDVVRITAELGRRPRAELYDGTFNLASGCTRTVVDLARLVQAAYARRTGQDIPLRFGPPSGSEGDRFRAEFSVDRLKALGLAPSTDLDAEIDSLLETCFAFFGRA